ncbi:hypothetical protein EVAR_67781_1 [Eumeta japonica]|uniref:Uncharacterized protein n=1 Tax=Eumeta variegata TaxID=151549 RepID=A0A4C1ZYV3_EUMVA|nr:hypothetical protein EVAR_67781_1 [Eumeta japonica]
MPRRRTALRCRAVTPTTPPLRPHYAPTTPPLRPHYAAAAAAAPDSVCARTPAGRASCRAPAPPHPSHPPHPARRAKCNP